MKQRRACFSKRSIVYLLLSVVCFCVNGFTIEKKFTPKALELLSGYNQQEINAYWIYLDSSAIDFDNLAISEASLQRRAKADPINFLIDEKDYHFKESVISELSDITFRIRHQLRWLKAVTVDADAAQIESVSQLRYVKKIDVVNKYKRFDREKPEPYKVELPNFSQAVDYGASQAQIEFTKADRLHQANLTGAGIKIAMFDTGFDISHPSFANTNIIETYDFINNDITVDEQECPDDFNPHNFQTFHGTATLGVIGANDPGSLMGIAYNADYYLAKTEISCYDTEIFAEEDNWIAAAQWADALGADIINSSLGYYEFTDGRSYTFDDLDGNTTLVTIAADIAASKNILVVNSAGNERQNVWGKIIAPADGDSVLAVGAVALDSVIAGFSSPGPSADGRIKPDIVTLGTNIYTSYHLGGLTVSNGTSFSAPLVAGSAALIMEHDNSLTAFEISDLIRKSGNRYDTPNNDYGYGVFDAVKAADIIKFDPPYILNIQGSFHSFPLTTSGTTDSIPILTILSPIPLGIQFVDNKDGTANLDVNSDYLIYPVTEVKLTADVGYFVDTFSFTIVDERVFDGFVKIGPNPFNDSLNIFIDQTREKLVSLSIYNANGEIVWEKVNNFNQFADVIIEQWDGRNQLGYDTAAGVYILIVKSDRQEFHLKLLKVDT